MDHRDHGAEGRALPRRTGHGDRSAQQRSQLAAQRQAQSGALDVALQVVFHLGEFFEDDADVLGRDADTAVGHTEAHRAVCGSGSAVTVMLPAR
jgi:hypothetical protein